MWREVVTTRCGRAGATLALPDGEVRIPAGAVDFEKGTIRHCGVIPDPGYGLIPQQYASEPIALRLGHVADQSMKRQFRRGDWPSLALRVMEPIALGQERGAMKLQPPVEELTLVYGVGRPYRDRPRSGTAMGPLRSLVSREAIAHTRRPPLAIGQGRRGTAELFPVGMSRGNGHEFDTCPVGIRHKENTFGLRVRRVVASFLKNHTADRLQFQGSGLNIVDDEGKMGETQVIPSVGLACRRLLGMRNGAIRFPGHRVE